MVIPYVHPLLVEGCAGEAFDKDRYQGGEEEPWGGCCGVLEQCIQKLKTILNFENPKLGEHFSAFKMK